MARQVTNRHVRDNCRLQEHPLLTALTIMLALWLFVISPLHNDAIISTEILGFALSLMLTAVLLVLSNSPAAAVLMLLAIGLASTAALLRFKHPSVLDVCLNAGAWLLIGVVLIWGVGKAVFAPGRITYHRIMGAILLYLGDRPGVRFALHPARPAYPRCLHGHVHHR